MAGPGTSLLAREMVGWLLDEEAGSRVNSGAAVPSVTVEDWESGR